jgi:hypothetical protein
VKHSAFYDLQHKISGTIGCGSNVGNRCPWAIFTGPRAKVACGWHVQLRLQRGGRPFLIFAGLMLQPSTFIAAAKHALSRATQEGPGCFMLHSGGSGRISSKEINRLHPCKTKPIAHIPLIFRISTDGYSAEQAR